MFPKYLYCFFSRRLALQLTYRGDDRYCEVERPGEFPLSAGSMRLRLQHHSLDLSVVVLGEAVPSLRVAALLLQHALPRALGLGLQGVEDCGAHQQIREHAEDERQRAHVLLLHLHPLHSSNARLSASLLALCLFTKHCAIQGSFETHVGRRAESVVLVSLTYFVGK